MYNPASIVDLRQNISFNQPRLSPILQGLQSQTSLHRSRSFSKPDLSKVQSNYSESYSDPSSTFRTNQSQNMRLNHAASGVNSSSQICSCFNCSRLLKKVADLETRLEETEARLSSFQAEVVESLRGVLRAREEHRESHVQLNFPDFREPKRGPTFSPSLSKFQPIRHFQSESTDATREAIANACQALEGLIAEASERR